MGESSRAEKTKVRWKKIWGMKVSSATKHFLWRSGTDSLPTKSLLYKRKIVEDSNYPICLREEESIIHAL